MLPSTLSSPPVSFPPNSNTGAHVYKRRTGGAFHGANQVVPLLRRCESINQFPQIHALAVKTGQDRNPLVLFKILRLCTRLNSMDYALQIFDAIEDPDVYHYTALVEGHIALASHRGAIQLYFQMVGEHIRPDAVVISYVAKACASSLALSEGRQVHCQALKLNLSHERPIKMKLMELYGRCAEFGDAKLVFGEMPERDAVAATILISGLCDHGLVKEARAVFDSVRDKDTVCWTAIINGCARNGAANTALELFREMQTECIRPNEFTVVCVLSACSQLGALELGRWAHSYLGKYDIKLNAYVGSALIDMYSKCGNLEEAFEVFDEMPEKDVVSYNSMIAGLAMHGRCSDAVKLYKQMIRDGLRPTRITFVGVLNACSHSGLVDVGFEIFKSMTKDYGLEPQIEHYGCMVDLLARVGRLEEAYEFAKTMRIEPDHIIWGALVSACKIHNNLDLAEKVAKILIDSEAADSGTFILLSNVYSSFGKWEEAARIRAKMRGKGILKEPGCSSIEVDNEIHEFLLGDIRHPQREDIYKKLEDLNAKHRELLGYEIHPEWLVNSLNKIQMITLHITEWKTKPSLCSPSFVFHVLFIPRIEIGMVPVKTPTI
ncbi:pentatricopeptide repeat-containing protein [Canna indica]|uniref:Pentatricopeptide repeat-containing protein n=1 Tax=Canna indica TaxID=4628 RepID=A0AAQ3JUB4_9LILI|nr:pentatricopeptide repeat-containing protein [Canna indica]